MRRKSNKTFDIGKIIRGRTVEIAVGLQKNSSMIRIQRRKDRPDRNRGGRAIKKTSILIRPKELKEFIHFLNAAKEALETPVPTTLLEEYFLNRKKTGGKS